jgi:cysteine desulfurase/selenocysteine lyase
MSIDMSLSAFREAFPLTRNGIVFVSHCAVSPLPQPAVEAITGLATHLAQHGGTDFPGTAERLAAWRSKMAALLNATPDEIAFIGNTVSGVNLVANGIRWRQGDNIISADIEFPANVYPWQYQVYRGVETRLVPARDGRIELEDLFAAVDDRTRLIALSYVQFLSGFRLDVQRIGEFCRQRGIYFFLDAIQGLGALHLDVQQTPVDFLAAGGHKWLLGPAGSGVFYCRREVLDDLVVSSIGHGSMVSREDYLPYRLELRPNAARFEGGGKNGLGIFGLEASVDLILQAGIERVEAHILGLGDTLLEALQRKNYRIYSPHAQPSERSGIVSFAHPQHEAAAIKQRLKAQGIIVTTRSGWVRVAPHFYNTAEDIDRLIAALP